MKTPRIRTPVMPGAPAGPPLPAVPRGVIREPVLARGPRRPRALAKKPLPRPPKLGR